MIVAKFHETQVKKSSTIHMCICKSRTQTSILPINLRRGNFKASFSNKKTHKISYKKWPVTVAYVFKCSNNKKPKADGNSSVCYC